MNVEELTRDQLTEAKGMMVIDSINAGENRYNDVELLTIKNAAKEFSEWCDSIREQCRDLTHDETEDVICIMCEHENISVSDAIKRLRHQQRYDSGVSYADCYPEYFAEEYWD